MLKIQIFKTIKILDKMIVQLDRSSHIKFQRVSRIFILKIQIFKITKILDKMIVQQIV